MFDLFDSGLLGILMKPYSLFLSGFSKFNKDKSGSSSQQQQRTTTTVQPTEEEREFNKLLLEREKALDPQVRQVQSQGFDLINRLLTGGEAGALPGFLEPLPRGIDENVTSGLVNEALRDITPSFQQSGLFDSGVRASVSARTAGDIRRNVAESNLNNLFNLLNLAVGGQAQIQAPRLQQSAQLSQALSGLRGQTTTGTGSISQRSFVQPSFLSRQLQFAQAGAQAVS